ncbi:MAG TPA: hypothetical protein DCM62_08815 [Bacteroidales bacterium]|nr:hypothetical protein [Bacteroidales bacterium]
MSLPQRCNKNIFLSYLKYANLSYFLFWLKTLSQQIFAIFFMTFSKFGTSHILQLSIILNAEKTIAFWAFSLVLHCARIIQIYLKCVVCERTAFFIMPYFEPKHPLSIINS